MSDLFLEMVLASEGIGSSLMWNRFWSGFTHGWDKWSEVAMILIILTSLWLKYWLSFLQNIPRRFTFLRYACIWIINFVTFGLQILLLFLLQLLPILLFLGVRDFSYQMLWLFTRLFKDHFVDLDLIETVIFLQFIFHLFKILLGD